MKTLIFSSVVFSILLFSCKKDTSPTGDCGTPLSHDKYMPLEDNNFWVYQRCNLDTLGNKSCSPIYDTVFVIGDKIINGIRYKKLKRGSVMASFVPEYIRESQGHIFSPEYEDSTGLLTGREQIVFSQNKDTLQKLRCRNFSWTPNCSWKTSRFMELNSQLISVPAGGFYVLNAKELSIFSFTIPFWGHEKTRDFQCCKNIGLIRGTTYFASHSEITEFNLVSYRLN